MKRLVQVGLVLSLVMAALAGVAGAQDRSVVWERFDIDLTVREDGSVGVVETQKITFEGGPFRFGFATIPLDRIERIVDVAVYEGDRQFKPGRGQPYTFETSLEGGEFNIRWYFPETSDSTHTYTFKYTALGALRIYEGGDQVWWTAIDRLDFPVRASTVTVHLPEGVTEVQNTAAYGVPAEITVIDQRTVAFEATDIRPGQGFEVRVQFPHGIVEASPPAWQPKFDQQAAEQERQILYQSQYKPIVNLLVGFVGLFIPVVGLVGLFLLWYTRGRDAPVPLVADYLPNPPDDLPPGVAGTLLDETADMQDIIATIVDLARRGVITMTEKQEKGFLGIGARRDFVFEKQDHQEALRPYEKTLLEELFGRRTGVRLSALKEKFYTAIPELKNELYEEVVRAGFFQRSPESTRRIYTAVGFFGFVLSIIVGFFALAVLLPLAEAAICLPFGLAIVSLGMILVGRVMPRKTTKGSEAAARWRAFRRYLENIEKYTDLEQAKDIFDRYLPYAIAFGLENNWVRKFAEVDAPAPPWYRPAGGPVIIYTGGPGWPRHGRRVHGGPVLATDWGTGSGGAGRLRGGGEGGGLPDLQRTSDRMAGGLQSMSDGLATMLNVAGSVLAAAPRASGSGGGWSGGGGGGFGGGGGSGGGSRGFG